MQAFGPFVEYLQKSVPQGVPLVILHPQRPKFMDDSDIKDQLYYVQVILLCSEASIHLLLTSSWCILVIFVPQICVRRASYERGLYGA